MFTLITLMPHISPAELGRLMMKSENVYFFFLKTQLPQSLNSISA